MEQNFVLRVNTKSWEGFRLVNISRLEHVAFRLNPQFVGFSCKSAYDSFNYWKQGKIYRRVQFALGWKSSAVSRHDLDQLSKRLRSLELQKNKMPTNWWGRQNAAPLKFDPKPSEVAFSASFRTSMLIRCSLWRHIRRGCRLGRHGCPCNIFLSLV